MTLDDLGELHTLTLATRSYVLLPYCLCALITRLTHWKQDLFMVDCPLSVQPGDTLEGCIRITRNKCWRRHLKVVISYKHITSDNQHSEVLVWFFIVSNSVSRYQRCLMVSHDVLWRLIMSYGASCWLMVSHGVLWCLINMDSAVDLWSCHQSYDYWSSIQWVWLPPLMVSISSVPMDL